MKNILILVLKLQICASLTIQAHKQTDINGESTEYVCTSTTAFKPGLDYESVLIDTTTITDHPTFSHRYPARIGNLMLNSDGSYYFTNLKKVVGKWTLTGTEIKFQGDIVNLFDTRQMPNISFPKKCGTNLEIIRGFYLTVKPATSTEAIQVFTCTKPQLKGR